MIETLSVFFADFGVNATVAGQTVRGIHDRPYAEALHLAVGTGPILVCASADLSGVYMGDAVVIGSDSYTIAGIHPDGTGVTTLVLESA